MEHLAAGSVACKFKRVASENTLNFKKKKADNESISSIQFGNSMFLLLLFLEENNTLTRHIILNTVNLSVLDQIERNNENGVWEAGVGFNLKYRMLVKLCKKAMARN